MKVLPAVDILQGRCVQLVQGDRERATFYGEPKHCAKRWIEEGADALHIINLDGAFGEAEKNVALIRRLIKDSDVTIQLGGGIRSVNDATSWLDMGVERIILGTLAVRNPTIITVLAREYGSQRIVAGVDTRSGQIVVEGWMKPVGDYLSWAQEFVKVGAGLLLFTNVDLEGLQQGILSEPIKRIMGVVSIPVIVAGGIAHIHDIIELKALGVHGVVLGSALYSAKISLGAALEAAK